MDMSHIKEGIETLTLNELARAIDTYGANHSRHEGYAVLLEEYDEMSDEYKMLHSHLELLWEMIKADAEDISAYLNNMYKDAVNMASEAIQVIAMIKKMEVYEDVHKE